MGPPIYPHHTEKMKKESDQALRWLCYLILRASFAAALVMPFECAGAVRLEKKINAVHIQDQIITEYIPNEVEKMYYSLLKFNTVHIQMLHAGNHNILFFSMGQ